MDNDLPMIVTIKDKEYKFGAFTKRLQQSFARYMQYHYLTAIKAQKDNLGDEFQAIMTKFSMDVRKGQYDCYTSNFAKFIMNDDGSAYREHLDELVWYILTTPEGQEHLPKSLVADWEASDSEGFWHAVNEQVSSKKS